MTLRSVYEEHLSYVWHTLRRLGVRDRDLEDLAHDTFVVVHRALPSYDRSRPIRPWLFGVAFRVASDYRRRASFSREIPTDVTASGPGHPTAGPRQIADLEALERRQLVQLGLEALPLEQRAAFVMHELEGHTMPQIAEALGVKLNTLYSRLRLGRTRFAAAVREARAQREVAES